MSVDGNWNIVVSSPMGDQPSTLSLKDDGGGALSGVQGAQGQSSPIANGKIDGDTVTWANSITQPFPMTLEFTGTLSGDTLNGNVKAGSFGTFPFKGSRA
ncbi:MAG TPA: hypothetical protein VKT30_19475 [Caulobacteraceae bacterium]|nr:hypothetical protein [Caulobacteraceae bacterium]